MVESRTAFSSILPNRCQGDPTRLDVLDLWRLSFSPDKICSRYSRLAVCASASDDTEGQQLRMFDELKYSRQQRAGICTSKPGWKAPRRARNLGRGR